MVSYKFEGLTEHSKKIVNQISSVLGPFQIQNVKQLYQISKLKGQKLKTSLIQQTGYLNRKSPKMTYIGLPQYMWKRQGIYKIFDCLDLPKTTRQNEKVFLLSIHYIRGTTQCSTVYYREQNIVILTITQTYDGRVR